MIMALVIQLLVLAAALLASQLAYLVVARLLLSPLRAFPGPKWAALTEWWEVLHTVKCTCLSSCSFPATSAI